MSISIEALKVKLDTLLQTISLALADKLDNTAAAVSADRLTNPFTLSLTNDATATANVDGSRAIALSVILKTVMASPGTHTKVTVDAKGRVVAAEALLATDIPNLDASKVTTGVFAIARIPTLNQNTTGNAATATKLATPRQIAVSGDATGTALFDGGGNISIPLTLKASGVAAGSYGDAVTIPTFSVDGKGIVTLAQNVAIRTASLTVTGLVRLSSLTDSISETMAATPAAVKAANDNANSRLPAAGGTATGPITAPAFYSSNWFRSTGASGWYSETHGGGIYMADATWVRVFGGKNFYCEGTIAAVGDVFGGYSDERLKTNIVTIEDALSIVHAVDGVFYNANDLAVSLAGSNRNRQVGFLANQVEKVLPEVLRAAPFDIDGETGGSLSGESYKTLAYDKMLPVAFEAIKQLHRIVLDNQATIEDLRKTIDSMNASE